MVPARSMLTLLTVFVVSAIGNGVESASPHMLCNSDHQCPDGFFCYEDSHYCTQCVDCSSYKRKSSWRSCPKTPSDCGACLSGHEEEILHEGKTRDMCIPSMPNFLSHTNVTHHSYERYLWAAAVTALLLPIVFYAFCRKSWRRELGTVHHGIPHEDPPPYRSIELTTLTSNSSEEILPSEELVMQVGQQKDNLVQATPFRQPSYETELLAYDNSQEENHSGDSDSSPGVSRITSNIELHDENTMPSEWTPAQDDTNDQLMTFEIPESGGSPESEDACEPVTKRKKTNEAQDGDDSCNTHLNINLFINNNVTIHKPT